MNKIILAGLDYLLAIRDLNCVCGHKGEDHNGSCHADDYVEVEGGGFYYNESPCPCKGFLHDTWKSRPFTPKRK